MKKVIVLAAGLVAAAGASSAPAAAAEPVVRAKHVSIAGAELDYTSTYDASGRLRLRGADSVSRKSFDFRVYRDGFVSGTVDGKSLTFWVPRAQRSRAVEVVAREIVAGAAATSAGSK